MRARRLQHIIANVADNADDSHELFWLTESGQPDRLTNRVRSREQPPGQREIHNRDGL
jgi:hypothetical protein